MRQIIIDTETTGLEPAKGHRVIEIGCVELVNRKLTGNEFHQYINPEREVEEEAIEIHGITNEFLLDKPIFSDILSEFLEFIKGAELIAHNAKFDVGFINHEIKLVSKKNHPLDKYVTVFDTLALARKKFPGQRNSLDAVCKRYKIDLSGRELHGALLDAQLLAEAYLRMTGGQGSLFAEQDLVISDATKTSNSFTKAASINQTPTKIIHANEIELIAHDELLKKIKKTQHSK